VCAAVLAGFYALLRPPLDSLVPRVVPREQLKAAMALEWVRGNVGMIAGPAIGGVLIAAFGVPLTYGIDLATFLISLGFLALMRASPPPADADAPSLRSIAEGLRYAGSRPELLGTYLVDINAMLFGMPQALFPAIAASYGGAEVLGFLLAAPAVGSLVVALFSGWTRHVHRTAARWRWPRPGGAWRSSPSASRTCCGWRSRAWRWRGRWTRSPACSAA
jgi:MFS family permease